MNGEGGGCSFVCRKIRVARNGSEAFVRGLIIIFRFFPSGNIYCTLEIQIIFLINGISIFTDLLLSALRLMSFDRTCSWAITLTLCSKWMNGVNLSMVQIHPVLQRNNHIESIRIDFWITRSSVHPFGALYWRSFHTEDARVKSYEKI